jgi:hypothetical protein
MPCSKGMSRALRTVYATARNGFIKEFESTVSGYRGDEKGTHLLFKTQQRSLISLNK